MTLKLCVVCGEPCLDGRCDEHRPEQPGKANAHARGYTSAWFALSRKARKLQPWCSECGTKDDLTGDHLRWPAKTLKDVDVLCRSCNSAKGAPGGTEGPTGGRATRTTKGPRAMANSPTVPLGGIR